MENTEKIVEKTEIVDLPVAFEGEDKPKVIACTSNICANGHEWVPELGMTACRGCNTPLLLIRMVQCPICNEPVAKFRLRTDHLPKGGVVTPICQGSATMAESVTIEIGRHHAEKEQTNHKAREIISKP